MSVFTLMLILACCFVVQAFESSFDLLAKSKLYGTTTRCNQIILFLTDGESFPPTSSFLPLRSVS